MEKELVILNNIRKKDKCILTFFAFGSFVTNQTTSQNYKEIRVFDDNKFLFSRFKLSNTKRDIDVLCVSSNPEKTEGIVRSNSKSHTSYFLTINVISKEVFEREVFSNEPKAIRLILLFRELLVIKGKKYINSLKEELKNTYRPIDKIFQDEYDFRKDYQKLFSKYNVDSFSISRDMYEELFPNFLRFITGKMKGGFPEERIKIVLPEPVNLKNKINIASSNLETLL